MLAALPLAWRVAGGLALVLALLGGALGLYFKGRADGNASCRAAVAEAVAEQERKDKELSEKLLGTQKAVLDHLHGQALAELSKVNNAPVTKDCGPVMRGASHGVRDIIGGGTAHP